MPFTPFHFGPGMLLKGLIPGQLSLSTFALANIAIDIEPFYHMLRGDLQLHGASHTLPGATVIGIACALLAPALFSRINHWYQKWQTHATLQAPLTRMQIWMGALLGSSSHLLLDAPMHGDMLPLLPFDNTNPLLHPEWTQNIYLACVLAGMLGMLLALLRTHRTLNHPR